MLKKVVLPAPFGPMIDTIDLRGMSKLTSSTATSPPKILLTPEAERIAPSPPAGVGSAVGRSRADVASIGLGPRLVEGLVAGHALRHLDLAAALREQALRPREHHHDQQEPEDPERDLRRGEVEAEHVVRKGVECVRDQLAVDEGEHDRAEHHAPYAPQPAE